MSTTKLHCHVIVIGAGLAGLSLALGLRNIGHTVTVLERASEFQKKSSAIDFPPNACRAAKILGILECLEARSLRPESITIRSYRGDKALSQLETGEKFEETFGMPYLSTVRANSHNALAEKAIEAGINLLFKINILHIDFDKPSVHLQNGTVMAADLVVGADGEASQTRSLMLSRQELPYHYGHILFGLEVPKTAMLADPELAALVEPCCSHFWMAPGALFVLSPHAEEETVGIVCSVPSEPTSQIIGHPIPADMQLVRKYHANWDHRIGKMLELVPGGIMWTSTTIHEQAQWSHQSGHFIIIGDAAHAMTPYLGQGAAQCFEDAAVLTALFAKITHKDQIHDLLIMFERIRKPRVGYLKRKSHEMREIYCMPDGPRQRERDRQLKEMSPFEGSPIPWLDPVFLQNMYGYDIQNDIDTMWSRYARGELTGANGSWRMIEVP